MTETKATVRATTRLSGVVALTRGGTVVAAVLLCVIGAVMQGPGDDDVWRIALATVCVGCSVAFAQVVNDLADIETDRLGKSHRPLVNGAVSERTAALLAAGLATCALGAAALGGPTMLVVVAVVLAASWGYSRWWKDTVLVGNVVVAVLASAPVSFGAAAAGGLTPVVVAAQAVIFLFMLAFEVAKTGLDHDADLAIGLRTVATVHGTQRTARLAGLLCVAFALAAPLPGVLSASPWGYALVMGVGAVAPAVAAAVTLLRRPAALTPAFRLLRLAWFAGIASLALL